MPAPGQPFSGSLRRGGDAGFPSDDFVGLFAICADGGKDSLAKLVHNAGASGGQEPWNYNYLIGLYRAAFGAEKVIVLPYELLRDHLATFLGHIARRLGVVEIPAPEGRPNPSLSGVEMAWLPHIARRIGRIPWPGQLRAKVWRLYFSAAGSRGLARFIALLQRIKPLPEVSDALLPAEVMAEYAGFATLLRDEPLYAPYALDYLFAEGEPSVGRVSTL